MQSDVQKPTLAYFHLGGKGEVARLALEVAGVDYHYHSITYKNSPGESWEEYKNKHADELTFGQIPHYKEPGGVSIVQSSSITRYVARKYGLNGSNEHEAVAIDVLFEGVLDLLTAVAKVQWADESNRANEANNLFTQVAPKHLANFQRALEHNHGGQGYLVGDKVSYADVAFFVALKRLTDVGGKEVVEKHGPVHAYHQRLVNHPHIKKFYDSEPYKF